MFVIEVLKTSKPFRISDLAPPSGPVYQNNDAKTMLVLLTLPTPTGAQRRTLSRMHQYAILHDSVSIDRQTYQLRDLRITLAMAELTK